MRGKNGPALVTEVVIRPSAEVNGRTYIGARSSRGEIINGGLAVDDDEMEAAVANWLRSRGWLVATPNGTSSEAEFVVTITASGTFRHDKKTIKALARRIADALAFQASNSEDGLMVESTGEVTERIAVCGTHNVVVKESLA
jgi:hypothetical protein